MIAMEQQFEPAVQACYEEMYRIDVSDEVEGLVELMKIVSKYGPRVTATAVTRGDK
jgi:hypothetical protein